MTSSRKANKAHDALAGVYRDLRRVGAQERLSPLLRHPEPAVAAWAGAHALEFAPDEGVRVLEDLAKRNDLIGLDARQTLSTRREGKLTFPMSDEDADVVRTMLAERSVRSAWRDLRPMTASCCRTSVRRSGRSGAKRSEAWSSTTCCDRLGWPACGSGTCARLMTPLAYGFRSFGWSCQLAITRWRAR